ncbi:MAG: peptidase M48 [Gammaproteobacteria bacterium]|nr:peptidase M48 [Gammaproteobacteria bacterium]
MLIKIASFLWDQRRRTGLMIGLVFVTGLNSISCSVNPATGGANLVFMSEDRERELGAEEHAKILASQPALMDEDLQAFVEKVGQRVAKASHRPELEYTFTIIDSPVINAMALPGGYVYLNRGLLAFLNSEAQLAAVLAHEIGHITARHAVQQQARGKLASVAATVGGLATAAVTGSTYAGSQISQVASIWALAGLSGFGREMELEADRLGAEYILKAGYDPAAMIDVVSILKSQEDFNRRVSGNSGSYHGLFASHPRNDTRLQEAVGSVGELAKIEEVLSDNSEFREHINGLAFGLSSVDSESSTEGRYYQPLLGYSIQFPDDWEITETTTTVTAELSDKGVIRLEARRLRTNVEPRVYLSEVLGITDLQKSEAFTENQLIGHTGLSASELGQSERVGVIYLGSRAFVLRGQIIDAEDVEAMDEAILRSFRSFRAIQRNELMAGNELRIKYVQASEFFDFAVVGRSSKIGDYPEERLRLLNGYYPRGNPEAGEWVKLVE